MTLREAKGKGGVIGLKSKPIGVDSDAFATLMRSSKAMTPKKVEFFLYMNSSGKFLPSFSFSEDVSLLFDQPIPSENCWTTNIKIKNINCGVYAEKRHLDVVMKTNIPSIFTIPSPAPVFTSSSTKEPSISAAVLKSMLQKAMRRRKGTEAIRLATELYNLSPNELLRRLPVIIIEDLSLHPAYPILVWCLLAESKGYALPPVLQLVTLQVILEVTLAETRDNEYHIDANTTEEQKGTEEVFGIETVSPGAIRGLLCSLVLRASFGGMPGDMHMLQSAAVQWKRRLVDVGSSSTSWNNLDDAILQQHTYLCSSYLQDIATSYWGVKLIKRYCLDTHAVTPCDELRTIRQLMMNPNDMKKLSLIFPLRQEDLLIEGIDFHCDWKLIPSLKEKMKADIHNVFFDDERAKLLIWTFRSSINNHRLDDFDEHGMSPGQLVLERQLENKRVLAKEWKTMCKFVNEYCSLKCSRLWKDRLLRELLPKAMDSTTS